MNFNFRRWNNIIGWAMFVVASIVYLLTMQRTVSWWDCGEFISATYKLEVPHQPGNPTFQLIGRIFTLFAGNDVTKVAVMVNTMSALCSGLTIMFLFWSITMLGRKIVERNNNATTGGYWALLGAGMLGALAYTFSDTFWFSAVEGEVYAMSSFFTAVVFWATLRWEREADHPNASRWLILIFFLIGLAIGVHLLNLLTVPALVYVYYYRKFDRHDWKGWFIAGVISVLLVAFLMYVVIPWTVQLAGYFELFFVNTIRLPFNSGTIIYFILLIGAIVWGVWYTQKHIKPIGNTIMLCLTYLLIGYSTFFMIVIRANEVLPINMSEPKDALSLVSYLNRDQYGTRPLLYGQYYSSPIGINFKEGRLTIDDGAPVYAKDPVTKKYFVIARGNQVIHYEPDFCTIFPRMYSKEDRHVSAYKEWGNVKGRSIPFPDPFTGERKPIIKPTFGENMRFFFSYQIVHMYWRYFMWNFSGRQNDIEGHGGPFEGNWITGFDFLDKGRVGSTHYMTTNEDGVRVKEKMPESMGNSAHNTYYLLPFILGLLGLAYHIHKDPRGAWIVFLLFFMTGLAIVIYLNQAPYQPRERDYAYAGSFYAFCIWIGFAVMAAVDWLKKYANEKMLAVVVTVLFLGVPILMGQQNWDDHDRSKNRAAHDYGINYLLSCPPNAILYTNGDNDTYPLWYAQEVEGIRPDVRIINYQLSNGAWYANQMAHKINDSERLPLTLTTEQYRNGSTDVIELRPQVNVEVSAKEIIDFVKNPKNTKAGIPTKKFYIPVNKDKILAQGLVTPAEDSLVESRISLQIPAAKTYMYKHELLLLDILATNDWERPICFTSPAILRDFLPLDTYFHLVGTVYQLLPYQIQHSIPLSYNGVRIDSAYHFFMNEYLTGDLENPNTSIDRESMASSRFPKLNITMLAQTLQYEKDSARAIQICDRYQSIFPEKRFPATSMGDIYYPAWIAECYVMSGAKEKGEALLRELFEARKKEAAYLADQTQLGKSMERALYEKLRDIAFISRVTQNCKLTDFTVEINELLQTYQTIIGG